MSGLREASAVNLYHRVAPVAPATARVSPASREAPNVVSAAGRTLVMVGARAKASLEACTATRMATVPRAPAAPSTCSWYVVPGEAPKVTQEKVGRAGEGQSSLAATRARRPTRTPVYTASSVLKLLPSRDT
jgi:hypothetical protein